MGEWVRLCGLHEAPREGDVCEVETDGVAICLARKSGKLHALDNWCPHRRGPLGQGWIEDNAVVCPWHSWAFDCTSGHVLPPDGPGKVSVYAVKIEDDDVLIQLG